MFALYQLSGKARTRRRWRQSAALAAYAVGGFLLVARSKAIAGDSVVALVVIIGVVGMMGVSLVNRQERMLADRLNDPGLSGEHELELTDETLIERTAVSTTAYRLGAIRRIVERPDHYLIYVSPMHAYVVPKAGVGATELDAFIGELGKRCGLTVVTTDAPAPCAVPPA